MVKESKSFEHINHYKTIRSEIIDTLLQSNKDFIYSDAHHYVELMKKASTVELMLLERSDHDLNHVHNISSVFKFNDAGSVINQMNIFDDNSMAIKKKRW